MMTLHLSKTFATHLQVRQREYLQQIDGFLAKTAPADAKELAEADLAIWKSSMELLVSEVFCNVMIAIRVVVGSHADRHFDDIVRVARDKAIEWRNAQDAEAAKAGAS